MSKIDIEVLVFVLVTIEFCENMTQDVSKMTQNGCFVLDRLLVFSTLSVLVSLRGLSDEKIFFY